MKEDYLKALKKLMLFFLSNPVLFNGQSYLKQKRPGMGVGIFQKSEKHDRKYDKNTRAFNGNQTSRNCTKKPKA